MNEELIKIFDMVCIEYQHMLDRFKLLVTLETIFIALILGYIFKNITIFTGYEEIFFYGIIIVIFICFLFLIAIAVPRNNFILAKFFRKDRKISGNIFYFSDIATYDTLEYLQLLQDKQVIKKEHVNEGDLSQAASIIHKANSTAALLERMQLALYSFIFLVSLVFFYCLARLIS